MDYDGLMGKLNDVFEWVMRFAYINVLWFAFTLAGLILFGIFPATAALYAVARKWKKGSEDIPIFRTFWEAYRKEFIKANILGYIMVAIGYFLYWDFNIIDHFEGMTAIIMSIILSSISVFFAFTGLFLFPVLVHYKMNTVQYIKNSVIVSLAYPFHALGMLTIVGVMVYVNLSFPVLIPFFSISVITTFTMNLAHDAFGKLEEKLHIN